MNMIKYPYTDFHEMNLDWILNKIKELEEDPSTDELEGRVEALEENAAELNEDSAWFKNRFKMFAVAENLMNFTYITSNEFSEGLVIFKNANEAKITVAKLSYVNGT